MSKGMVFYSPYASFQVLARSEIAPRYDETGAHLIRDRIPALTAEFAEHAGEYEYENPLTGEKDKAAFIRGHYFDSALAQERNGWSDEEREYVERVLLELCKQRPGDIRLYEEPKPTLPWPTYEKTHHERIAKLADELGLVPEALAYERANKRREGVIEALEAKLRELEARLAEDEAFEALTAA